MAQFFAKFRRQIRKFLALVNPTVIEIFSFFLLGPVCRLMFIKIAITTPLPSKVRQTTAAFPYQTD